MPVRLKVPGPPLNTKSVREKENYKTQTKQRTGGPPAEPLQERPNGGQTKSLTEDGFPGRLLPNTVTDTV